MTPQKVIGLLIGFAGIIILFSEDLFASQHISVIGQAAVILASLFYAGSAVYARKVTQHVKGAVRAAAPLLTATLFMWMIGPVAEIPFKSQLCPSHGSLPYGSAYLVRALP